MKAVDMEEAIQDMILPRATGIETDMPSTQNEANDAKHQLCSKVSSYEGPFLCNFFHTSYSKRK